MLKSLCLPQRGEIIGIGCIDKIPPTDPTPPNLVYPNRVLVLWERLPEPFELGEKDRRLQWRVMDPLSLKVPSKGSPCRYNDRRVLDEHFKGRVGDAWNAANGTPCVPRPPKRNGRDKKSPGGRSSERSLPKMSVPETARLPTIIQWPDAKAGVVRLNDMEVRHAQEATAIDGKDVALPGFHTGPVADGSLGKISARSHQTDEQYAAEWEMNKRTHRRRVIMLAVFQAMATAYGYQKISNIFSGANADHTRYLTHVPWWSLTHKKRAENSRLVRSMQRSRL